MKLRLLLIVCLFGFLLPFSSVALAQDEPCGLVTLLDGWARPSPAGAPNGAVFGLLVNLTGEDDTLVSASGDIAEAIELHEMVVGDGDVMQMRPIEGGMPVKAGGYTELRSGGLHIMLINLTKPLVAGEKIDLTLHFEIAGDVPISVPIREMDDEMAGMGGDMGGAMSGMAEPEATPDAMAMPMPAPMEWPEACAGMHVLGGWTRAAAAGMPNSAAYGLLVNLTGEDDTLVSVSGEAADAIELHEMSMGDGDVMQMRPVEGGIVVPAGGTALLQPGGLHIMLVGLTGELPVETTVELTLTFASGAELTLDFPVREDAAEAMPMGSMG